MTRGITISVSAQVVTWGSSLNVSGVLTPHRVGDVVEVMSRPYGARTYSVDTTTKTLPAAVSPGGVGTPNGFWTTVVTPERRTEYLARASGLTSTAVVVEVAPRLTITKGPGSSLSISVKEGFPIPPTHVSVQRHVPGGWTTLATAIARSTKGQPLVATAAVGALPFGRYRVRAYLAKNDAEPGYVAGASPAISYHR